MILNGNQAVGRWGPHGPRVLQLLATGGPASRERLHQLSGLHRSLVGDTVRRLMDDGLVCLGEPEVRGRGRPQTPVTLDTNRRCLIGLAIEPGLVTACRVSLLGEPIDEPLVRKTGRSDNPIATATALLRELADDDPLCVGVTVTGVVDLARGVILQSSAFRRASVDLGLLRRAAGDTPLLIENDLHALTQHWRLRHHPPAHEDILLVRLADGKIGAALLLQGQPHEGCVHAASELGHTRLAVDTRRCYCGRRGCLERVFDSRFAIDTDGSALDLLERLQASRTLDATIGRILDLVGLGVANAVQLIKPHRLVLVSPFGEHARFRQRLTTAIRREMLGALRERVQVEWDIGPTPDHAVLAAYPALAWLMHEPAENRSGAAQWTGAAPV